MSVLIQIWDNFMYLKNFIHMKLYLNCFLFPDEVISELET